MEAKIDFIHSIENIVETEVYGAKAYWLSWLFSKGFNVPFAYFFPAFPESQALNKIEELKENSMFKTKLLDQFKSKNEKFNIAIRSSGTLEDNSDLSNAGHFLSVLGNLDIDEILKAMKDVVQSNIVTSNSFNRMGIVLQQKIDAKRSGVIFSSNPINASKSECIINTIDGMGADLVSGKQSGKDFGERKNFNSFRA